MKKIFQYIWNSIWVTLDIAAIGTAFAAGVDFWKWYKEKLFNRK